MGHAYWSSPPLPIWIASVRCRSLPTSIVLPMRWTSSATRRSMPTIRARWRLRRRDSISRRKSSPPSPMLSSRCMSGPEPSTRLKRRISQSTECTGSTTPFSRKRLSASTRPKLRGGGSLPWALRRPGCSNPNPNPLVTSSEQSAAQLTSSSGPLTSSNGSMPYSLTSIYLDQHS